MIEKERKLISRFALFLGKFLFQTQQSAKKDKDKKLITH